MLYFQRSRIAVLREGEAPAEPWRSPIWRLGRSLALPLSVAVPSIHALHSALFRTGPKTAPSPAQTLRHGGPEGRSDETKQPREALAGRLDCRSRCLRWGIVLSACSALLLAVSVPVVSAEPEDADQQARKTAVALNYCRASFHRILRYPSKRVLVEEQEKILNNLNLNGIADEEVIKLYTAVLEEISGVQIAEKERKAIRERHRRVFYQQLSLAALDLTAQLATARYAAVVRTGANSWWDFRAIGWHTELDTMRLENDRLAALTGKSAQFLDTFWKLTRKRNIRDRWLVRNSDLDRLETALREPDLEVRLRVLRRMKNFMECYPPYWYYVARTQQQLGQLFAAAGTYEKLEELGAGHFRKDDMLAAGLANRAVIQHYLQQPDADKTARKSLRLSTDVWEVNLMCAQVLGQHKHFDEAEDALLRNLDVDLEHQQSLSALLLLYAQAKNKKRMFERLSDLEVTRSVPVPVLLRSARLLASDELPKSLIEYLRSSMFGYPDLRFGRDDLVFVSAPGWQLSAAQISLQADGQTFNRPDRRSFRDRYEIRFRRILESGSPLKPSSQLPPATLTLRYPDAPRIRVHFQYSPPIPDQLTITASGAAAAKNVPLASLVRRSGSFRMTAIDVGETVLPLLPTMTAPDPVPVTTSEPAEKPAGSKQSLPDKSLPAVPPAKEGGGAKSKPSASPRVECIPPPPDLDQ